MMPRKKKKLLTVISILIVIIIIAVIMVLLYMRTDMFKSNSTLFAKYVGQNLENVNSVISKKTNREFKEKLEQNKYTSQTQVKANLVKEVGTTAENTENSINYLNLMIDGQIDKSNNYNYQDISLLNNNEKAAEIEYMQNEEVYGLRFKDLFNQYILVNKESSKETLEDLGVSNSQIENISEDIVPKIKEIFNFNDEELQAFSKKYVEVINNNVSKDSFSKQGNQTVQIDEKNIKANAYILTLTKEQLNNVYIKILEELKQDEIILSKINKIKELMNANSDEDESEDSLKERYSSMIDEIISDINNNNIGQEETKVIVYESNGTTVKTVIQSDDYEIDFSVIPDEYMQLSLKESENESNTITYKINNEKIDISFENKEEENTKKYSIEIEEKITDNNSKKEIIIGYEDDSNKFELNIEQEINIVDEFENTVELNDKNSIKLDDLEEEQKQAISSEVSNKVAEEINDLTTNVIKIQDISEVLKIVGIMDEPLTIEGGQVTEAQRNRFNSKFEMLQGNELEKDRMQSIIEAIEDNLIEYEVASNTEIRLKIDQTNSNEETVDTIKSFIEENDGMKYSVKVEYDETTGLVNSMLLTLIKD